MESWQLVNSPPWSSSSLFQPVLLHPSQDFGIFRVSDLYCQQIIFLVPDTLQCFACESVALEKDNARTKMYFGI